MSKVIGIDLGTTFSRVAVWDEKKQAPILIPNLAGEQATPSVVGLNEAGEVVVGSDAKLNYIFNPENTVWHIKREMGRNSEATMGGKVYNPQTISAFILRYLRVCAEKYLGEPVYDAVITVPAFFSEVGRSATRDAGQIAGLNVLRLVNEPTAAAIAYSGKGGLQDGHRKIYVVYDLGGGKLGVSVIEITAGDISVVGTGGDPRLGGLDMDEEMMMWALRQIKAKHGFDLGGEEAVKRRLTLEVETVKRRLVMSETADLCVPFLTMVDGQPFNLKLSITRSEYELLIQGLLDRSLVCLEEAVASSQTKNAIGWEDLDGVLLVGGPTRLQKVRDMLKDRFRQRFAEHGCPGRSFEIKSDFNPDEIVTMGAAIVAASMVPLGKPAEEVDMLRPLELKRLRREQGHGAVETSVPEVTIFDVVGHSLGVGIPDERGVLKFRRIINKETGVPVSETRGPFGIGADGAKELLVDVYQGEEESIQGNTKIGTIHITGLEPQPPGQQFVEITFTLDASGVLSTVCTDLRTKIFYEASFKFDGITRMSKEEIERKRQAVAEAIAYRQAGAETAPRYSPDGQAPRGQPPSGAIALEGIPSDRIPKEWTVFWDKGKNLLPSLPPDKKGSLIRAMDDFASAVRSGSAQVIEEKGYLLQDIIFDAGIPIEGRLGEVEKREPLEPLSLDENVQFTVYRPRTVQPAKWYPLVAFAHLSERPPDASISERDPVEEVKRQARQVLGEKARDYQGLTQDSRQAVPREGELMFLPEVACVEFNPPSRSFLWLESVHREEFRLRASEASVGQTLRGHLSVFLGRILLADVPLAFRVDAVSVGKADAISDTERARPYRKIFASYSHRDLKVVEEVERYARAVGDRFLRDWVELRSGEVWSERLEEMIKEADIFQLFWSTAAMASPFVRQEWECALSLNRPEFVRPVYWEDPFPVSSDGALPPADLRRLHFQRLARPAGESAAGDSVYASTPTTGMSKSAADYSVESADLVQHIRREGLLSSCRRVDPEQSSATAGSSDGQSQVYAFGNDVQIFLERMRIHPPQTPDALERAAEGLQELAQRGRRLSRCASPEATRILEGLMETIDQHLRMISGLLRVAALVSEFNMMGKHLKEHPIDSADALRRLDEQLGSFKDRALALLRESSEEQGKVLNDVLQTIESYEQKSEQAHRSLKDGPDEMTREISSLWSDLSAVVRRLQEDSIGSYGSRKQFEQELGKIRARAAALPKEASRELIKVLDGVVRRIGSPVKQAEPGHSVTQRSEGGAHLMEVPWVGIVIGLIGIALIVLFSMRGC
jgi:molecular chaperone DnaK